jgi:predicted amidohydrolase
VRAAAIQLNATDDVDRNLQHADRLTRRAAAAGAELVVLPEKWTVLGTREQLQAGTQSSDGPALAWARSVAAELGIELVAGSLLMTIPGSDRAANASLHVRPDGEVAAVYRKVHLFDVEVDGKLYAESATEQAGDEIVLSRLTGGQTLGMSICFDLRFPELYAALAAGGADIISVPSAFTLPTTRDHWEVLVRARAIETGCFVVAANQIGHHPGDMRSGGRSLIVDPWGVVLATAPDAETVIVAELDFEAQREVRRRIPSIALRRPEVYAVGGR